MKSISPLKCVRAGFNCTLTWKDELTKQHTAIYGIVQIRLKRLKYDNLPYQSVNLSLRDST